MRKELQGREQRPIADSKNSFARFGKERISEARFCQDALMLSRVLPNHTYVLNFSDDRYLFSVGFLAAILRKQTVLLPGDKTATTKNKLKEKYPDSYDLTTHLCSLHEKNKNPCPDAENYLTVSQFVIPDAQVVAIPFTSGSTGEPMPHPKTWGHLRASVDRISERLALPNNTTMISTVPAQHMYGLELSVLLPMFKTGVLSPLKPFYPQDIQQALEEVGTAKALVTTPIHLRALLSSKLNLPRLDAIISATAPLTVEMACEAEKRFETQVTEVYGCTEAGSLATRRPVQNKYWRWFRGVEIKKDEPLEIMADYLPNPLLLSDRIRSLNDGTFELTGRMEDLINIAGKRTSLAGMNHCLLSIDGVQDGAFVFQNTGVEQIERLIALVVAPDKSEEIIMSELRNQLDPVFLPRKIVKLISIPRTGSGKLTKKALSLWLKDLEE